MFEITIDLKIPKIHRDCDKFESTQDVGLRLSVAYVTKMFLFFSKPKVKGLESRNGSLIICLYYVN
jgi:hypothetical protein